MSKDDRLLIFFAGLGVGVAGTLLFAPASGSELRSRLRNGAGKTGEYLKTQAAALKGPLEEVYAQGKQVFNETVSKGNDALGNLKDKVKDKIDDASDKAQDAAGDVIDKSRDLAHQAGKTMEKGGKRLQDA